MHNALNIFPDTGGATVAYIPAVIISHNESIC
mgnify:CR=1 FL=1